MTTQKQKRLIMTSVEQGSIEGSDCGSLTTEWLTSEEAAEYLRISVSSLLNLSSNGKVPYYKWQRRNRYKMTELRELLLNERRGPYGN